MPTHKSSKSGKKKPHPKNKNKNNNKTPTPISALSECALPKAQIGEILSRLPVKSLIRFRCVCKPFKTLISTPHFIKTHLLRAIENPKNDSLVVHTVSSYHDHVISVLRIENVERPVSLPHPFPEIFFKMDLVGSVNGLVCLACPPLGVMMVLWNPAMKMWKAIAIPKMEPGNREIEHVSLGFGYDSVADDYKIVRVVCLRRREESLRICSRIFVYSVNRDLWREVKIGGVQFVVSATRCNAIANGVPYWTCLVEGGSDGARFREVLVSFDVKKEVFRFCPVLRFEMNGRTSGRLVTLGERLGLVVHSPGAVENDLVDVYVLDGEWRKVETVGPVMVDVDRMFQCFKNGEIAIEDKEGKLFVYDPKTNAVKSTEIEDAQALSYEAFSHVESLVTIKGMERVGKEDAQVSTSSGVNRDEFLAQGFDLNL